MSTESVSTQFRLIPLRQLDLSPLNVRKTGGDGGISALAELVSAEGVLQNLSAYESPQGEAETRYAVVAGGRRWRALRRLLGEGRITNEYPVPCVIVSYERAVQISLAENSGREPMLGLLPNLSSVPRTWWRRSSTNCFCLVSILNSSQQRSQSELGAVRSSGCESADWT
jgi:hypothetical protein